jgi:hypothetical protein
MYKKFLFFLVSLIFTLGVKAQYNTVSPYSRFGIGNIENQTLGRALGMGGISAGVRLPFEINSENPASYSAIPEKVFLFQVGTKIKRTDFETTTNTIMNYDFWLSSINAAFRGHKYWAMSFGMNPLSSVGYSIETEDSVIFQDSVSNFRNYYSGEGGLTKIYLGNSFAYKGFSVGVNASYIFGPLSKKLASVLYDDTYSSLITDIQNIKVNDFNLRFGLQYSDSIFKNDMFTVGGFLETKTDLNAKLIRFTTENMKLQNNIVVIDTLINDTLTTGTIGLPLTFGLGFTLVTQKLIFGLDYKSSLWQDVKFFDETTSYFANSSEIAFGAEYTKDYASKQYWKTINVRAGARFSKSNLVLNNTQINGYGITFGAGFPSIAGTKINIAFEIGKKGTIENNLILENYYMMNLNFNLTDSWFIRRKFF